MILLSPRPLIQRFRLEKYAQCYPSLRPLRFLLHIYTFLLPIIISYITFVGWLFSITQRRVTCRSTQVFVCVVPSLLFPSPLLHSTPFCSPIFSLLPFFHPPFPFTCTWSLSSLLHIPSHPARGDQSCSPSASLTTSHTSSQHPTPSHST